MTPYTGGSFSSGAAGTATASGTGADGPNWVLDYNSGTKQWIVSQNGTATISPWIFVLNQNALTGIGTGLTASGAFGMPVWAEYAIVAGIVIVVIVIIVMVLKRKKAA
jgi:hypothetical protein